MITAGPLDRDLLASVDDVDTEGRGCLHDGRAFRGRAQTMARRRFRLRVGIFWHPKVVKRSGKSLKTLWQNARSSYVARATKEGIVASPKKWVTRGLSLPYSL